MTFAFPKPSYKRLKPKQGKRGEFSKLTRDLILERDEWSCQQCGSTKSLEIHHVVYRSSLGRGVVSNGLTVCSNCHRMIHNNPEIADAWRQTYESRYGRGFWKDQYDE